MKSSITKALLSRDKKSILRYGHLAKDIFIERHGEVLYAEKTIKYTSAKNKQKGLQQIMLKKRSDSFKKSLNLSQRV